MISFVAKSAEVDGSGGAGVGVTVNLPFMGSIQPGDLLIIHAGSKRGGTIGSITTSQPGWSGLGGGDLFQDNAPANAGNAIVLYKIANGTESGTVPIFAFCNAAVDVIAQMYQYRQSTGQAIRIESSATKMNGNGNGTVTWNAITVGGNARTLLAFSVQLTGNPNTPAGYTQQSTDTALGISLKLADWQNVGSDGLVTASGGSSLGWATHHLSLFSASGRSFFMN